MAKKKQKPSKPYKDFPLFAHANGQWVKKIRGKHYCFGVWDDPDAALTLYEKSRNDLYAGREPTVTESGLLTLEDACNLFLAAKMRSVEIGELSESTYKEYKRSCSRLRDILGRKILAEEMTPGDFEHARTKLAKQCSSPVTLKNELTRWRVLFKWMSESGTISKQLPFATVLKRPPARDLRASAKSREKLFSAEEVRSLVEHATGFMKSAVLLGINCGMGNRDCCQIQWKHVQDGWLDFSRPKTGVARRAKLWPETVEAMEKLKRRASSDYICCTESGRPFGGSNTPIAHLFESLAIEASVERKGRGFYCLRHTYRTVVDEVQDQPAIMFTMGHADHSISGVYRQAISDKRLEALSDFVKGWLGA